MQKKNIADANYFILKLSLDQHERQLSIISDAIKSDIFYFDKLAEELSHLTSTAMSYSEIGNQLDQVDADGTSLENMLNVEMRLAGVEAVIRNSLGTLDQKFSLNQRMFQIVSANYNHILALLERSTVNQVVRKQATDLFVAMEQLEKMLDQIKAKKENLERKLGQ